MRYRIFRKKTYIMYEQAPISEADSNALAARNCEGTEQLRVTFNSQLGIIPAGLFFIKKEINDMRKEQSIKTNNNQMEGKLDL